VADPIANAKMVGLLALLDVLADNAEMTAIGADRVGANDAHGRAGTIRLKFTIFGQESRLVALAGELAQAGSNSELMRLVEAAMGRDEKLRLAARMIAGWTEVMQREVMQRVLADRPTAIEQMERLAKPDIDRANAHSPKLIASGRRMPLGETRCHPGAHCANFPACESCGPARM
jgi:hypothetical protein